MKKKKRWEGERKERFVRPPKLASNRCLSLTRFRVSLEFSRQTASAQRSLSHTTSFPIQPSRRKVKKKKRERCSHHGMQLNLFLLSVWKMQQEKLSSAISLSSSNHMFILCHHHKSDGRRRVENKLAVSPPFPPTPSLSTLYVVGFYFLFFLSSFKMTRWLRGS